MKKLLTYLILAVFLLGFTSKICFARGGFKYIDGGGIYTNVTFPEDIAKAVNTNNNTELNMYDLKCGEAVSRNILLLIDVGDAGIAEAAKKAGITKIMYVDSKISKVYIPLGFIPIYIKERKTKVYGE